MSDQAKSEPSIDDPVGALARSVQQLVDAWAEERAARERMEVAVLGALERIAAALERGGGVGRAAEAGNEDRSAAAEVRAAIGVREWDRAAAIVEGLSSSGEASGEVEAIRGELSKARERAVGELTDRIGAARQANDAAGALAAHAELGKLLASDALKVVDRDLIGWLMKLIQRRLRSIPVGGDLAGLAAEVANRFSGTPEGASLRAALPTLRRSAGLCPRCAEPYIGVDEACPKCLALAGQVAAAPPTLTFVTDDLDAIVTEIPPVDLNNAAIWENP